MTDDAQTLVQAAAAVGVAIHYAESTRDVAGVPECWIECTAIAADGMPHHVMVPLLDNLSPDDQDRARRGAVASALRTAGHWPIPKPTGP